MPDSVSNGTYIAYLADDADTKAITYSGAWGHLSSGWNESYQDTGSTGVPGSQASMTFKGSIVAAVAAIPADLTPAAAANPPNVSWSIDGGPSTRATVNATDFAFLFVQKDLEIGQHTVTLTVEEQTDAFQFGLDLFVYAGPDDVTVPIGATQQLPDDGGAGTTGYLQDLLPQLEKAQQAKSSGPPVGPIVGGVIGGTALLVIVSLVVWYLFIRPRRRGGRPFFYAPAKISDMLSSETADAKPEPFTLFQPTNGSPGMAQVPAPARRPTFPPAQSAAGSESVSGASGYGYGVGTGMAGALGDVEKGEKADARSLAATPPPATYHADSGVRFGGADADAGVGVLSDVPPTYSQK